MFSLALLRLDSMVSSSLVNLVVCSVREELRGGEVDL